MSAWSFEITPSKVESGKYRVRVLDKQMPTTMRMNKFEALAFLGRLMNAEERDNAGDESRVEAAPPAQSTRPRRVRGGRTSWASEERSV